MTQLIPMNEAEYEAFMEISVADHIQGQIKAGYWHPEEAKVNMQKMREKILPQGLVTPNHHFFKIVNGDHETVGGLWYMVLEQDGTHLIFVIDIQVYESYRRMGFGSQAFRLMEDQAAEMGIHTIALNVFEHNHSARKMYQKLGYSGEGESMVKEIEKTA